MNQIEATSAITSASSMTLEQDDENQKNDEDHNNNDHHHHHHHHIDAKDDDEDDDLVERNLVAPKKVSRQKRGILGVPIGKTPILFDFKSKELWPDDDDDDDENDDDDYDASGGAVGSDEDYHPSPPSSPANSEKAAIGRRRKRKQAIVDDDDDGSFGRAKNRRKKSSSIISKDDDDDDCNNLKSHILPSAAITNTTTTSTTNTTSSSSPSTSSISSDVSDSASGRERRATKVVQKVVAKQKSGNQIEKIRKNRAVAAKRVAKPKNNQRKPRVAKKKMKLTSAGETGSSAKPRSTSSSSSSSASPSSSTLTATAAASAAASPKSTGRSKRSNAKANGGNHSSSSSFATSYLDFACLNRQLNFDFAQIFPPEILVHIFGMVVELEQQHCQTLIKLSQVCENWRCLIIRTPKLWERLDFAGFADDRFPFAQLRTMHSTNQTFACVREIDLVGWNAANAEKMIESIGEATNFDLERLSVKNCRHISNKFVETIIRRFPRIRSLDLSAVTFFFGHNIAFFDCMQSWSRHGESKRTALRKPLPPCSAKTTSTQSGINPFANATYRALMERCGATLRALYVSENVVPSFPSVITNTMEFCHELEVLDVSNLASFASRSISISIDRLQTSCPRLRVLRAANINFTPNICTASAPPVPGFPHLEELSIPFHESFVISTAMIDSNTDWTLECLNKAGDRLTLLDIRGWRSVTPRGLLKIPTWSMKHLSISGCPKLEDTVLEMVFAKWNKTLVDVDMSWNKSDACVRACIQALCDLDADFRSPLRTIQLRGSAISYEMLCLLLRTCRQLVSIDLQSCRSLPRGIKRAFADEEFAQFRADLLDGKYD